MICVNYCIQCLQGFSFSEYGMRINSTVCHVWCFVHWPKRSYAVKTAPTMWPISHRFFFLCLLGTNSRFWDQNAIETRQQKREREREGESHPASEAPLWIISRYICHISPAHGGSNGAPWPGLCALLSALWKSPKNSRQKHILTHTADIHLDLDTAGSDLSPLLNNNMVDHNHSTWLSS